MTATVITIHHYNGVNHYHAVFIIVVFLMNYVVIIIMVAETLLGLSLPCGPPE
jgi:hypothetical protein